MWTKTQLLPLCFVVGFLSLGRLAVAQTEVTATVLQDTFIRHAVPDANYGFNPTMLSGNVTIQNNWRTDALIQFDLPPVPEGQTAESAKLDLFHPQLEWANRGSADFGVTAILYEWFEEEDTWDSLDADFAEYGDVVYDIVTFEGLEPPDTSLREDFFPDEWVSWDVTELVQAWYAGTIENNGLAINGMVNFGDNTGAEIFPQFYTKDFGDESLHPMLVITFGEGDPLAPLDDGTLTDPLERTNYVHNVLNTWVGDSNLDGEFNSGDLVAVFTAGHYEDEITDNSSWVTGDWNGDKEFSSGDLVAAFADGGFEQGPRQAVNAIPEPASFLLLVTGLLAVATNRRRLV